MIVFRIMCCSSMNPVPILDQVKCISQSIWLKMTMEVDRCLIIKDKLNVLFY